MIAKSLIVNGAARFLNTIYANNLAVSGTTSFASITTTTLTVDGTSSLKGTTVTGTLRIINTAGGNVDTTSLVLGKSGTDARIRIGYEAIQAMTGSTGKALFLNYYGGNVYLSNDYKIYASNGTFTTQDLIVTNELRSFKWNIQHIANLGGTFLVTPTLKCTANSATFQVTTISGTTITAAIKDSTAITGYSFGGGDWNASSRIKISGKIGGITLDSCDGQLTTRMNTSAGTLQFTFTYPNQSTNGFTANTTYTASQVSDLTVMLLTSYLNNNQNPIGIYMTSYDTNKRSHISLYGGTTMTPVVRIGYLSDIGTDVNGMAPTGWGIYTDNGFFKGTIVATAGKIGNFSIESSLYSGKTSYSETTNDGVWIGTDGIGLGKGKFYVTSAGAMTCTSGKIGNFNISTALYSGKTSYSETTNNGVWIGTDGIGLGKGTFYVTSAGALTCTSGTIGTWIIGSNDLHTGTWGANNSAMLCTGTNGSKSIGGSSSINGWVFTAGANFGVTKTGEVYANSVHLTGEINASSGTLGNNNIILNSNGIKLNGNSLAQLYSITDYSLIDNNRDDDHTMFLNSWYLDFDDESQWIRLNTSGLQVFACSSPRTMNESGSWSVYDYGYDSRYGRELNFYKHTTAGGMNDQAMSFGYIYGADDTEFGITNSGYNTRLGIYAPKKKKKGLELYNTGGTSPYVDFHYNNSTADYTSRIIANAATQVDIQHSSGSKFQFRDGAFEIFGATPLIDFHFNKSTSDYTSRILESASGTLKSYPGAIQNGSDAALKRDIIPIHTNYIELIDKLRPVEFRYKGYDALHLGFIAQDVERSLDEIGILDKPLISEPANEDDYYGLDYTQIIPLLVMYCKDLRREINELRGE